MPAKGEQETIYGGPWLGLDYSRPYPMLDPGFLAPGTVNASQINGYLTSSPWLAGSPYNFPLGSNEYVLGYFRANVTQNTTFAQQPTIVVTNIGVYYSLYGGVTGGNLNLLGLSTLHIWQSIPNEVNPAFISPGNEVSFVEVGGVVYFTGLMLNGIFSISTIPGFPPTFATATTYVSAAYLIELGGYLFAAECRFPGGGGTGTGVLPTVAWSGPGQYAGSGGSDPWNPVNNLGGGFNQLSDVPDSITGLAGIGRSALIFRNNGVSQCDPNSGNSNSGLQPFIFYHLWASAQGVGAYAGTVAQFGQTVFFRSSDNIYTISISSGIQPVGPRIIAKVNEDERKSKSAEGVTAISGGAPSFWYFSQVVNIAGQLHYLLCFSAYNVTPDLSTQIFVAKIYDYNVSENAWHIWDFSTYLQQGGAAQPFVGFSCRPFQVTESTGTGSIGMTTSNALYPSFILLGSYVSLGTLNVALQAGAITQLVPWDYDYNGNWITTFNAALYPPLAMPPTTIKWRAEIGTLGHKLSTRRLRVQANNAPLPSVAVGSQQQATVTLTGSLQGNVDTKPLAWTTSSGQTFPYMQGANPPQGLPIQTYYGDALISDEMVQPTLAAFVNDTANPWNSMPAFRISSASLIWEDPKSTTQ